MNTVLLSGIILGLLVAAGVVLSNSIPLRQRRARFESRHDLSLDQIYCEYFASKNLPKELVCELWKEVAESLRLSPGKLRPDDRFDKELAPPKGWEWDDDIVEVQWAGERRLKRISVKADLSQIQTLGNYIEFFCNLERQKEQV